MNRRKAILFIASLETMLLAVVAVLFAAGAIKTVTFAALALTIALVTGAVMLLAIRKLPPM